MYELTQKRKNKKTKAKTKIRNFHKNILKGGTENEVYKQTLEKYVPILPALEEVLSWARLWPDLIIKLIEIVQDKADEVGHSNMSNAEQLKDILQPALQEFIKYILNTTYLSLLPLRVIIRKKNINANTFIEKKISISPKLLDKIPGDIRAPHPTKPETNVTERKNILLIIPDKNKLIPEFIKDLKVLQKGINYSGDPIQEYVFPEENLPQEANLPQETNLPPPTTDSEQLLFLPARKASKPHPKYAVQLSQQAAELIGGKKKYKTRNKLSKSRGKMYSRRRRKNNRRY